MKNSGTEPRRAAAELLDEVLGNRRLLSEVMAGVLARLSPQDRARAGRLALVALRHVDSADRLLGPYLAKRPPLRVHNVLRLAVAEMFAEGAAAHGVVNSAVEIVRDDRRVARLAGLANAVLRKVAGLEAAAWEEVQPPRLPKWLRKPLVADYGKAEVVRIEAAHAAGPGLDLTVRDDPSGWAARLGGAVLPTGSVRLPGGVQVSALEGYAAGAWWVQDAAAALPARLLRPETGARVLDMCAAPGGKTLQLAAAGAEVTALDISEARLGRLRENLDRTGLRAEVVAADALEYDAAPFDAVLLDAPCSATGTIRRHPDLPHAKDGSDFTQLFELQARMLDRAVDLLKPGGRLVFCTCSLLVDEGEEQVRDALARHPELTVRRDLLIPAGVPEEWAGPEGLRTLPSHWAERGGMDGFFITVLQKPA